MRYAQVAGGSKLAKARQENINRHNGLQSFEGMARILIALCRAYPGLWPIEPGSKFNQEAEER